jgi:hypothetical protein
MTTEPRPKNKLRPKYSVRKIIDDDPAHPGGVRYGEVMLSTDPEDVDSPFVLMPRKDPAAFAAMVHYARVCEPKLAAEIANWLAKIAQAEPIFGSQGIKNFEAVRVSALEEI